jgi:hypothetical protein
MTIEQAKPPIREQVRRGRDEFSGIRSEFMSLGEDLRELASLEQELARAEMREQLQIATRAAMWAGVGVVAALIGGVFVFVTLMLILDLWMPLWLAALVTTGVIALIAVIAVMMFRERLRMISPMPKKTMDSIREDVRWARHHVSSSAK